MCGNNQVDIHLFKKASTFKTKSFYNNNGAFKPHPLTTIIISKLVGFERNQHRYLHKWKMGCLYVPNGNSSALPPLYYPAYCVMIR